MVLVVAANFLVSFGYIDGRNIIYPWLNLFGAAGIGINSYFNHKDWPAVVINIIWFAIAITALIKNV